MEALPENHLAISEPAIKITGTVTLRSHPAGTLHLYDSLMKLGRTEYARQLITEGKIETIQKNLVVNSPNYGLDLIIQRLIATNTYSLNITHGAIGTGTATPASSDTQLGNEIARTTVTYSADNQNSIAVLQFFFPDSTLPNDTYTEFATFVDGTSTAQSGQMFNHALFATSYTKTSGVDITVEVDFTITT